MSTVGLAIIARDEEERLPALLKSIEGAFDQIVLVDTGSEDGTIKLFEVWARHQEGLDWRVEHFEWCHDFSAARTYAHSLLTTDWEVWADCDDIIHGAQNLRAVAAQAPPNIAGYIAGYNYAQSGGECVCYLKRERLVRREQARWVNRVHEAQVVGGPVVELAPEVVEWFHTKGDTVPTEDTRRNLEILERWEQDEPENTRVLAYLGTENLARGDHVKATEYYHRYLSLDPEWDEERAQVHRKLAICYLIADQPNDAIQCAFGAMQVLPSWSDSYLTLAQAHHQKGEHPKAIEWAEETLRRGKPETLLIINPMDYTYAPLKVLAASKGALGDIEGALDAGRRAWELQQIEPDLGQQLQQWDYEAKRNRTAEHVGMMAQQLIGHDEQLKALRLLEGCIPHFAEDHPGIVNLRSELRERLVWVGDMADFQEHYETGGSKPEDFLPEDKCDEVAAALPRSQFLYEGIHEQVLEAKHDEAILAAGDQVGAALHALDSA